MNSLLQTLYMTPEFRSALYRLNLDDDHEIRAKEKDTKVDKNGKQPDEQKKDPREIPRQLQRLFALLQLSQQHAVKTKDLTKSFGWNDADAFTQHDVQELCRVLFDALERVLKGTDMANLINELYQGEMRDYVQCKVRFSILVLLLVSFLF